MRMGRRMLRSDLNVVTMTNAHRLFLQAILSQPAVPLPKAIYLYSASTTAAYNQDNAINEPPPCRAEDEWPTFRGQINELLDPLKLLLDEKIDQSTGTRWVMLVSFLSPLLFICL